MIAEGSGRSSLATTSLEMDAIDPSNFVMCSAQFARANRMPPDFGIPNDGMIRTAKKTYSLQRYSEKNVLYLFRHETGRLDLLKPKHYRELSVLGLATEGSAIISITMTFADGSQTKVAGEFADWFDGPGAVFSGFGRVKRGLGSDSNPLYHEGPPENPKLYAIDFQVPAEKVLVQLTFQNVTPGTNMQSNRAFIFAVSGVEALPPAVPEKKPAEQVITVVPVEEKKLPEARKITLRGMVTNAKTNQPVQATLNFTSTKTVTAMAEPNGQYSADFPDSTSYAVKVEATGYVGVLEKLEWRKLTGSALNFKLTPIEVGTHVDLKNVLFELGSAKLQESSYPELNMVVDFLEKNPRVTIELAGHTDNRGSKSLNLRLSTDRVNEVRKYLVEKGINGGRITGKGYGGTRPIAKGNSEEAHSKNRRVEFIITRS